jgi:hypothetical protein
MARIFDEGCLNYRRWIICPNLLVLSVVNSLDFLIFAVVNPWPPKAALLAPDAVKVPGLLKSAVVKT